MYELVILALSVFLMIEIPVSSSRQSSLNLTAANILFCFLYVDILIHWKRIVECSRKLIIITLVFSAVFAVIAAFHIIFEGKSIVNFIGIITNLFFYVSIVVWTQLREISKKDIVNACFIVCSFCACITFFVMVYVGCTNDVSIESIFPDHLYISVAGLYMLPVFELYSDLKIKRLLLVLNEVGVLLGVVFLGSRGATFLAMLGVTSGHICKFIFKEKINLTSILKRTVLLLALVVFLYVFCEPLYLTVRLLRNIAWMLPTTISEEENVYDDVVLWNDYKGKDIDLKFILNELQRSAARSDDYRNEASKELENLNESDENTAKIILGTGERLPLDDKGNVIYIHSSVKQIRYTFGNVGLWAYIAFIILAIIGLWLKIEDFKEFCSVFMFIICIIIFSLVQPTLTGGPFANVMIWMVYSLGCADCKQEKKYA